MIRSIPGINIQAPWAQLLLSGAKTVETRSYPIPSTIFDTEIAVIETGLKTGSYIIGTIKFSKCFRYNCEKAWMKDYHRHLVPADSPKFAWNDKKPKWAWVVAAYNRFDLRQPAPAIRGRLYAKNCEVTMPHLIHEPQENLPVFLTTILTL